MIEANEFLENFRSLFETTAPEQIQMETLYKELPEWDSLAVLSLIVLAEDKYKVSLLASEIEASSSVYDVYTIFKTKAAA